MNEATARGMERWLLTAVLAVVLGWYAYATQRANGGWVTREPQAYYEMLTEAILSGQTYLKIEPDPRLLKLPDPWAGPQGIPRAHDATYYNGKYYLYFGVAPVILLLAPWRVLTGTYLADGAAIGVFTAIGFLLAVWFYLRCRRRFFPGPAPFWTPVAVLTLGLGSFVQCNIWGGQFYQVPIACAFVCGLVAAHGVLTAALASTRRGRIVGLALASFAWGCSVGARPNFVVALPLVGLAALWLWWREFTDPVQRRGAWRLLVAAIVPAACVGAGLAAYNYVRFHSLFEFGLTYQFAAIDMRAYKLVGLENFWPAFHAYLLSPPSYGSYYPFARITDDTFGLLPWAPFALWAVALPFVGERRNPAWRLGAGFCLAVGLVNLGSLLIYSYKLERYELDFVAWLMLAALLAASAAQAAAQGWSREKRAALHAAIGLPLAWTLIHSVVHSWPEARDWPEVRAVARVLNRVPAWWERVVGWQHGPVAVTVVLPDSPVGQLQPLLSTGGGRDAVYLRRVDPDHYQFGFVHMGDASGILGDVVPAAPGSRLRLQIDLGGLYPPREHPLFHNWDDTEVAVLHRRVEIKLGGRVILRAESPFYASDPRKVQWGKASVIAWLQAPFTGRIEQVEQLAMPTRAEIAATLGAGPVRLRVKFPEFHGMVGEPLISMGRFGAGDLVYAFYLAPGRLRFAHDSWSYGQLETGPVPFDPAEEHVIEADFGGLQPAEPGPRVWGRLRLRFDGRDIVDEARPYNPARATEVSFGYNAIQASTADPQFRGEKFMVERMARWPNEPGECGPLALSLRLPKDRAGQAEPLVVTGRTGAGDIIYIQYDRDGRARIGYDCWGTGGPMSEPFAVEAAEPLLVQVSLGSLYSENTDTWRALPADLQARVRGNLRVRVNGRVVLEAPAHPHPSLPAEVQVGRNAIGASTCGERFTGEILKVQRIDAAAGW